jgi:hypothetical protein
MVESIKGSRAPLRRAQKAENAAYVAAELFSGGATPSLRSVFRQVSRTLRAPSTPHHKSPQARVRVGAWAPCAAFLVLLRAVGCCARRSLIPAEHASPACDWFLVTNLTTSSLQEALVLQPGWDTFLCETLDMHLLASAPAAVMQSRAWCARAGHDDWLRDDDAVRRRGGRDAAAAPRDQADDQGAEARPDPAAARAGRLRGAAHARVLQVAADAQTSSKKGQGCGALCKTCFLHATAVA